MPSKPDQRLRKNERLSLQRDWERVFAARCSAGNDMVVVYVAPNELGWSRLGTRVSRRAGNAVKRSYLRRRLREAFRRNKADLPRGFDIICIPRAGAAARGRNIDAALTAVIKKAVQRQQGKRS